MPVAASDLVYKYSIKTGAAGNSTASGESTSLGKYISTTAWADATKHSLFPALSGADNAASAVRYRCVFVHNAHATLSAQNTVVYVPTQVSGGVTFAVAIDNIAASAIGASAAQAAEIASASVAPTGVGAFSAPTTAGSGLALGNIAAGSCRAVWVRLTAANTAAVTDDGFTLGLQWDTAA